MKFLEIIQNCLEIFGIFIRFLDFLIRFMFEIFTKVYEIFSSDTPLGHVSHSGIVKYRENIAEVCGLNRFVRNLRSSSKMVITIVSS